MRTREGQRQSREIREILGLQVNGQQPDCRSMEVTILYVERNDGSSLFPDRGDTIKMVVPLGEVVLRKGMPVVMRGEETVVVRLPDKVFLPLRSEKMPQVYSDKSLRRTVLGPRGQRVVPVIPHTLHSFLKVECVKVAVLSGSGKTSLPVHLLDTGPEGARYPWMVK